MKKIAMMNCLKSNRVCTGAACLNAFNARTVGFERYRDEELELVALMWCNGCDAEADEDSGMIEKLERLQSIGTQVLHIGKCTKNKAGEECPIISKAADILERQGIQIVRGTH
ncbi:CGGC domain-containing protein [Anaeropeptidivorans aminofermentans]|jgi:predicted metal-binding protein|uniref:CGGC domain-containing protein n=1 Tax=Anaeropeptidivorans aminofermentans TaxID=2934315 RepID=UPI000EBBBABE|nr:CGGC domain-containing protein [Anaeropeptidivorans aminofermentans]MBE6012731.1 CGGC domain-containing protein [Lachnospiraceae bacterium]HAQ40394.1 CGGC domain-containing protein [Clostridiales bacterium]